MKALLQTLAAVTLLGACRPPVRPKAVTMHLSDDAASAFGLETDGGEVVLHGAAFLPGATDTTTVLSFGADSQLASVLIDISVLATGAPGPVPAKLGSYRYGGNTSTLVLGESYLLFGAPKGTLQGYDGGITLTTATTRRLAGELSFSQTVKPPVPCLTCADGLLHFDFQASFDLPTYPEEDTPKSGPPPIATTPDDG